MPETKIKIEICCGTTCYLLGGAELMKLESSLPEDWLPALDIRAVPCAETCTRHNLGGAPFVSINGDVMANATLEKLHSMIRSMLVERGIVHV